MYKAEYEDEEFEIILSENDNEALEEANEAYDYYLKGEIKNEDFI